MNNFNYLNLDGHSLELFLAVIEEGSVTAAATRLGLTQSAVSHGLDRLRAIVNDPLFVRSGRGIIATAHAQALARKAHLILDGLKDFSTASAFDPATANLSLTIAANDLQRDLLLPKFLETVSAAVRSIHLRVIPSDLPQPDLLRDNRCDLLISPLPPAGTDILQKRLVSDHYICFFDAERRTAPKTLDEYLAARHVTVVYTDNERLNFDKILEANGIRRNIAVSVPNFAGAAAFLHGTDMLASIPSFLRRTVMKEFGSAPIPAKRNYGELPLYLAWHVRNQKDPANAWLRNVLIDVAQTITQDNS
jgi:DNA-binding transcriptional LysR family regulator